MNIHLNQRLGSVHFDWNVIASALIAESLTGGVPFTEIPNKPGRYYAKLANGSTVNLRKVSTSADRTKARWTIEIIGDEQIGKLQDKVKKPVEIKFQ
ncbi:hemagglutinin [Photorhabdus laumondii]|uniref:Hemagglutinin n=1 Tax=Photorhabdus laumondii subsp. clarkei TaxID=2029685 RepID=A0A329V964_9GAMM|nr:hemagglutinin [Photorhabdus laumondii]RAW82039.1 hemagglutinin [Photorhabdus laumondii subsp. clarkei]